MSAIIRRVQRHELPHLLDLYAHLNEDDPALQLDGGLEALWDQILSDPAQHYLVAEVDGRPVSSCVLIVIKNLTRGARPYGLIENVVTHSDYRNMGYGTELLKRALEIARASGCYKVMLLTGRGYAVPFYERAGFKRGSKTGLIARFDGK